MVLGEKQNTLGAGGEEERKNNCAFLLRRQSAVRGEGFKCPCGWEGAGVPMALRLRSLGAALRMKPLSSPQ